MNKLHTKIIRQYEFNPFRFMLFRTVKLNLTIQQFIKIIGWSQSYQYQLETGKFSTISEKTLNEIKQVCVKRGYTGELGFINEDEPILSFVVNAKELRRRVRKVGLNAKEFSILAGWSKQYQCKLESKVETIISETTLKLIKVILRKANGKSSKK